MPPTWLVVLSWSALAVSLLCAGAIVYDIRARGHRQRMKVMEIVWPVTALYAGPLANLGYRNYGRTTTHRWLAEHDRDEPPDKPWWATVGVGVSHCGAGCTLGDIIAEVTIFALGLTILGQTLPAAYVGDYVLAVVLGLAFQYFAIAPMRGLGLRKGILAAAKADIASLTAFEVGLFGWMALTALVFFPSPHLEASSPVYWFMMQIGMCLGFLTAYPVNSWLIRHGVKEAM
jgi:hypothetical protein